MACAPHRTGSKWINMVAARVVKCINSILLSSIAHKTPRSTRVLMTIHDVPLRIYGLRWADMGFVTFIHLFTRNQSIKSLLITNCTRMEYSHTSRSPSASHSIYSTLESLIIILFIRDCWAESINQTITFHCSHFNSTVKLDFIVTEYGRRTPMRPPIKGEMLFQANEIELLAFQWVALTFWRLVIALRDRDRPRRHRVVRMQLE